MDSSRITRRGSLARLGGLAAALVGGGAWRAVSAEARVDGPAGVASGAVKCVLAPELTEGPYFIAGERNRRNITDGRPGAALRLRLTVVNASTCRPIKGAAVDIWHADAGGVYSGFGDGAASRTFMRGVQKTDADGLAIFDTVYPGWYQGRTVHIHVMVHIAGNVVHTGQLFFQDTITDAVYKRSPYSKRPNREVRNTGDSIFVNGGKSSLLSVAANGSGYKAAITMGVHAA
jgi:protocatechuate 3,4-dioxygenase beta subunit